MTALLRTLRITWRTLRLFAHILLGILLTLIFVNRDLPPGSRASRLTLWWHARACRIFGASLQRQGEISTQTTLYVCNHISWFDIPALGSQLPGHFLSKDEVSRWPVVGWFASRTGTLYIRRGASGAAQRSMNEIRDTLQQGSNVILFAEGTTSDGSTVRRFHSRLLQAAIDAEARVQAIAITYPHAQGVHPHAPFLDDTNLAESAGGIMGGEPMQVHIECLPPLNAADQSRDQLASICESQIREVVERTYRQGKKDQEISD